MIINTKEPIKLYVGDKNVTKCMLNDKAVYEQAGQGPTPDHIVQIRYWADTADIVSSVLKAEGGTPHITANGDGSYDLWSDDPCTYIGCESTFYGGDTGYDYYLDVTKIEVISGHTLEKFYSQSLDSNTFADLIDMETFVWYGPCNPTDMRKMFYGCSSLASLDLSNFDTSNVINMNEMFGACKKLTSLDFTNFDMSKVTDTSFMFSGCTSLQCITNIDTTAVTNKTNMFYNCPALTAPDATAQADITDADGANWVNPNPCPSN